MGCDDNTKTLHLFLPREIVEDEILSRLDVKTLLRLRCVSKTWRSSIDSDRFIKNHYRNSTKNTSLAHHRVIFDEGWTHMKMKQCSLQSLLDQPRLHPSPFDQDADNTLLTIYSSVVGCCNGLFCLVDIYQRYFLWNPATKIVFQLPKIPPIDMPYLWKKRGFCWDETTGAYKVFALSSDPDLILNNKRVARVYSSKTNSWKTVNHGSLYAEMKAGLYACGNLHWITKSGNHIESFELKSDSFGKIELPFRTGKGFYSRMLRLGEVRGCLSVLRELKGGRGGGEVWVMKEHGVKESWQKLIRIPRRDYGSQRCLVGPLPSGDMLVISGNNFWACGRVVKRKNRSTFTARWRSCVKALLTGCCGGWIESLYFTSYYDAYFYVESLVSPLPH